MLAERSITPDSGAHGKRYERAFLSCLTLAGLSFEENGLRGVGGALWDFRPEGSKWLKLRPGSYVSLKLAHTRTLFTSTDLWRSALSVRLSDKVLEKIIRVRLTSMKFTSIYWLKAKNDRVERQVLQAAKTRSKADALEVLREDNWSCHRLDSYTLDWVRYNGVVTHIRIYSDDKLFATITTRTNVNAGNTAARAELSRRTPLPPYVALREELVSPDAEHLQETLYGLQHVLQDTIETP